MGGRTGRRTVGLRLLPPKGRLAVLEHTYGIARKPLEARLRQAIVNQGEVDSFVERYRKEANTWQKLARDCENRRQKVIQGAAWLGRELSATRFDEKKKWVSFVYSIRDVLIQALDIQLSAARFLASAARTSTWRFSRGRKAAGVVNARLRVLVDEVVGRNGVSVPREQQLTYMAALAQQCGVIPENAKAPVGALRNRISQDHHQAPVELLKVELLEALGQAYRAMPMGGSSKDETIGEALRTAREVALGTLPELKCLVTPHLDKDQIAALEVTNHDKSNSKR